MGKSKTSVSYLAVIFLVNRALVETTLNIKTQIFESSLCQVFRVNRVYWNLKICKNREVELLLRFLRFFTTSVYPITIAFFT